MGIRFWRPVSEGPDDELSLVGCIASSQYLWVLSDGPSPTPPLDPLSEVPPEMLYVRVITASGIELRSLGGTGGGSRHGYQKIGQFEAPPQPSEPLTVIMTKVDGTSLWEVQAFPVG